MGEEQTPQEPDDVEYGGAAVPVENDPESMELRRASDHEHFWVPASDPLNQHPNRMICMICQQKVDQNVQSQPWAPEPTFKKAGY
jgi:hypothetical protein